MLTKTDIETYFSAEKNLGLWFMILGGIAIVVALIFFFYCKTNWHKGAAVPLLIIGLLQVGASFTVYKKSDADRLKNVYAFDMNPSDLKLKELPRMEKVTATFKTIMIVEVVVIVIAIGVFLYFRNNNGKNFWVGFAVTLFIEALLTLGADTMASKRAAVYKNALQEFAEKK